MMFEIFETELCFIHELIVIIALTKHVKKSQNHHALPVQPERYEVTGVSRWICQRWFYASGLTACRGQSIILTF